MPNDILDAAVAFYSNFEMLFKRAFEKTTAPSVLATLPAAGRFSLEGRLITFGSGFGFSSRRKDSFPLFDFSTLDLTDLSSMKLPERLVTSDYLGRFKTMLGDLRVHRDHLPACLHTVRPLVFEEIDAFQDLGHKYDHLSKLWDMSFVNADQGLKRMNEANRDRIERGTNGYTFQKESDVHKVEPEEIVRMIKGEADRMRALGQFSDALHLLEGIRAIAFATSNPFGLSDAAKMQIAAALVGVGHWTAHFAKNAGYRKRYLDFASQFDDPFFAIFPLISAGYDDPDSDAIKTRYDMLKNRVKTQITTYEFLGTTELYEISRYYVRQGAHPDLALSQLDGRSADAVMRQATEINLEDDNQEDALTEIDEAVHSYMQFDDLDKAIQRLEEGDALIPNRERFSYRNAHVLRLKGDLLWRIGQKTGQQSDYRAGNAAWKESHRLFSEMNLPYWAKQLDARIV